MTKRTLYLEDDTVQTLKQLANDEGCSESDVIREALVVYQAARLRPLPKGVGDYRSGRADVSARAEELLRMAARGRR
jgi:hypothetical protein